MSNGYYYKCDDCGKWIDVVDPFRHERRLPPFGWIAVAVNPEADPPFYRDYCSGICASRGTAGI